MTEQEKAAVRRMELIEQRRQLAREIGQKRAEIGRINRALDTRPSEARTSIDNDRSDLPA